MQCHVILVVILGGVELSARLDFGYDRSVIDARLIELRDIGLRDPRLLSVRWEDCRTILRTDVRALTVQLRRIMGDRKVDLQNASVADLARVKCDAHRFRMPGSARSDHFVMRGVLFAARIAGDRAGHAAYVLEHALNPPETSAGEDCRLRGWLPV